MHLVTNAARVEGRAYLRVHNPFNSHDHVEAATEDCERLEKMFIALGYEEMCAGEFWIEYDRFLDTFKSVKVGNLSPEKPLGPQQRAANKSLKDKTSLLTQWTMKMFEGVLPARLRRIKYCK